MMKKKSDNVPNAHLVRNGRNNKKLILAVSLLGVMAAMWIRVFIGGPKTISNADAVVVDPHDVRDSHKQECLKFRYHSLPFVMGRNDILSRDLFSKKPWKNKGDSRGGEPIVCINGVVSESDSVTEISDILESKLKAVLSGSEAFIDDKFYHIGDVLEIHCQNKHYKLRIVEIEDESVTFVNIKNKIKIEIKVEK